MEDQIGPTTASALPCGKPLAGKRQGSSDGTLRYAAIGVRRCARDLGFSSQPIGEFGIRFPHVSRQRVTTHRFVNRQVAN